MMALVVIIFGLMDVALHPKLDSEIVAAEPVPLAPVEVPPRWRLSTRIAFRFCVVYFGVYILTTQMLPAMNPIGGLPVLSTLGIVSGPVMFVIRHVFHDTRQLTILGGSGDKMFDWVFSLCLLVFAAAITLIWSVLDRRRPNYVRMHKWFRLFVRFAVATTMVSYGMAKFIPLQMPAPPLTRLLEPYGNFSPMGVLWYSIGASFPYERVVGSAELLAAVLLFVPMTATLGGIVALVDSIQIFALNMTYDVPVKLFSFHLILMSLFILAPDIPRLFRLLVMNRPASASTVPPLGRRRRAIQAGIALQILFGAFFLWRGYSGSVQSSATFGAGAPKPPLYGIWVIDRMTIDGIERAALVGDYERWRRVVVQNATTVTFWRMDDTTYGVPAQVDLTAKTITLTLGQGDQRKTVGTFSIDQAAPDRLVLDGALNGRKIRMETHLFPRENFLLVNRGFNWIQELPFNR